jgi:hypothetical protein
VVKRQPKSGISQLSHSTADKLMACLNHGVNVGSAGYLQNPDYFAACARWHAELTPDQRETVLVIIDAYTHARRDAAEKMAASLPSAPK